MTIRVAVIDDHPIVLKAIVDELEAQPDIQVVGTADHGSALPQLAREKRPEVVILDLGMSNGPFDPISAVQNFVAAFPSIKVMILTGYDDELFVQALIDAGARGYVLKGDNLSLNLPDGVRTVYQGQRFYTPAVLEKLFSAMGSQDLNDQELAVLRLAAQGLTNAAVARTLGVSEKRVSNILSAVYQKLNVSEAGSLNRRVVAVNQGRKLGLLPEL